MGSRRVKGLKARGNYEIDITWSSHQIAKAKITSINGGKLTVNYNGKTKILTFKKGASKTIK